MLLEVGGHPCELDGYRVATDLEQFNTDLDRPFTDPTEDPKLVGSPTSE